jgi:hypothetical protein
MQSHRENVSSRHRRACPGDLEMWHRLANEIGMTGTSPVMTRPLSDK